MINFRNFRNYRGQWVYITLYIPKILKIFRKRYIYSSLYILIEFCKFPIFFRETIVWSGQSGYKLHHISEKSLGFEIIDFSDKIIFRKSIFDLHWFSKQNYFLKMFYFIILLGKSMQISSVGAEYLCEIFEIDKNVI